MPLLASMVGIPIASVPIVVALTFAIGGPIARVVVDALAFALL